MKVGEDELRGELEGVLTVYFGEERRIEELVRRHYAYGSSFALEQLEVTFDNRSKLRILFKDLGPSGMLEGAREAKPKLLYDPLREIEVYRRVLARERVGTPECYGWVADESADRFWLFIEDVAGTELGRVGEFAVWETAARWLADMHGRFADVVGSSSAEQAHLLSYDAPFYRLWLDRARSFADERARPRLDWLASRYDTVVDALVELPPAFIHGEFYGANILVTETGDDVRICVVDWEMSAVGPALVDLAALVSGKWNEAEREALALAYREAYGAGAPPPSSFREDLDRCRLHLAVQWLGWSPNGVPGTGMNHDWLAEAMQLAERLEL